MANTEGSIAARQELGRLEGELSAVVRNPRFPGEFVESRAELYGDFLTPFRTSSPTRRAQHARGAYAIAVAPGAAGAVGGATSAAPWQCGGGTTVAWSRVGAPKER